MADTSQFESTVLATDNIVLAGGIKVAISDSGVEITSLVVGKLYVVTAVGGAALMHQDTSTAVSSNANFDICIPSGGMIRFRAIDTVCNFIEADANSTAEAAVYIAEVNEAVKTVPRH